MCQAITARNPNLLLHENLCTFTHVKPQLTPLQLQLHKFHEYWGAPYRDVALLHEMSMHPRLNRVILRFKAPGVGLITLQLCLTLYSRHHYYANAYTAIVAVLFSEGFLECASESGGRV